MALKETQPKVGHLRETSDNPTKKTGRGSGFDQVQGGVIGNRHGVSSNTDSGKSTRPVPKETQSTIGAKRSPGPSDGIGSVDMISDEGGTTSRSI